MTWDDQKARGALRRIFDVAIASPVQPRSSRGICHFYRRGVASSSAPERTPMTFAPFSLAETKAHETRPYRHQDPS